MLKESIKKYLKDLQFEAMDKLSEEEQDLSDELVNYDNSYISDAISEISDSKIDIYYSNLNEWVKNCDDAIEYCERAVQEGLIDVNDFDFYKMIQSGQYLYYTDLFYNNLDDIVKAAVMVSINNDIEDIDNIDILNIEDIDKILEDIDYLDNNIKLYDLWADAVKEKVSEILENRGIR